MKKYNKILSLLLAITVVFSGLFVFSSSALRIEPYKTRSNVYLDEGDTDYTPYVSFEFTPAVPGGITTLTARMNKIGRLYDSTGKHVATNNFWAMIFDVDFGDLELVVGKTDSKGFTYPKWTKGDPKYVNDSGNYFENYDSWGYVTPLFVNGVATDVEEKGYFTYGFHYEYQRMNISGVMFTMDFRVPENVQGKDLTASIREDSLDGKNVVNIVNGAIDFENKIKLSGVSAEVPIVQVDTTLDVGASVRMNDANGMRYTSSVDADKIDELIEQGYTVQMGTLIAPKDFYEDYADLKFEDGGENEKYLDVKTEGYFADKRGVIAGSIASIKEKNYSRDFYGRGYVKVLKGDEVINISYAKTTETNPERNICALATAIYDDKDGFESLTATQQNLIKLWAGKH